MTDRSEAYVQQQCLLTAPRFGVTLWRNNIGAAQDVSGRLVRYGLGGNGGSDLIGMLRDGTFFAVECKRESWRGISMTRREAEQRKFIELVRARGGVAGFVRSTYELENLIEKGNQCPITQND
jgi:hypothetical protein